jgi:predicted house-cleaning noncanonical NTP pyrophosphatase (MazG superfamily)
VSKATVESQARPRRRAAGLLIHPVLTPASDPPSLDFFATILEYGTKVAGLQILAPAWVPPYVALPAWLSDEWMADPAGWVARARRKGVNVEQAAALLSGGSRQPIIVRSSAVGEGLDDRGLYRSVALAADAPFTALIAAIEEIFSHFATHGRHRAMGICLQRYMTPDFAGHVSNELHISATRNQWKFQIETPAFAPDQGLNSKFAAAPDEMAPLAVGSQRSIGSTLRRACHWVNLRIDGRSHLEWCAANGQLWIVQLDQESPTSAGINPHLMPAARTLTSAADLIAATSIFSLYRVQDDPDWRKLRNIRDFWTGAEPPRHRLFFATGDQLELLLASRGGSTRLANEINALSGGRAVLRTDCSNAAVRTFNLPRTHTVDGTTAARWVRDTLKVMAAKGAAPNEIAIILHRYIPARASAWTYYSLGDDYVQVDCLWGLPDGLQFLPHDTLQIDARTGEELAAQIRFKPDFLQEQGDGSWSYVGIARQYGRDRVLSREALRHLALQTVAVARKIKDRAQIMWFCDLPEGLGMGQHLPWFRSKEFAGFEPAARPALPTRRARNLADLDALDRDTSRFIIQVAPEVELVREDDAFLDRAIAIASVRDLPVELDGSILGHAYYRLRGAGILVLVPQPKYPRVRGRHRHYKVVRDAIPQNIQAKGERVTFARLLPGEASVALIGKLFEEGLELNAARSPAQKVEELADVLEVVRGLAVTNGIDWNTLIAIALEKREKRGGFEQQTVLLETTRPMPDRGDILGMTGDQQLSISLRDLGVVAVEGASALISFSKLLSFDTTEVELLVDGRQINVAAALDGAGVRLIASDPRRKDDLPDSQLDFFGRNAPR